MSILIDITLHRYLNKGKVAYQAFESGRRVVIGSHDELYPRLNADGILDGYKLGESGKLSFPNFEQNKGLEEKITSENAFTRQRVSRSKCGQYLVAESFL